MNRPELYKKTVDILFDAYFNDALEHFDCEKCAVGNILRTTAQQLNIPVERWANLFMTLDCGRNIVAGENELIVGSVFGKLTKHIDAIHFTNGANARDTYNAAHLLIETSGYNVRELADVERAFESADEGDSNEDYMFNGLVAVLDVLKQIHEVEDNEPDVQRFRNHYATLTH